MESPEGKKEILVENIINLRNQQSGIWSGGKERVKDPGRDDSDNATNFAHFFISVHFFPVLSKLEMSISQVFQRT